MGALALSGSGITPLRSMSFCFFELVCDEEGFALPEPETGDSPKAPVRFYDGLLPHVSLRPLCDRYVLLVDLLASDPFRGTAWYATDETGAPTKLLRSLETEATGLVPSAAEGFRATLGSRYACFWTYGAGHVSRIWESLLSLARQAGVPMGKADPLTLSGFREGLREKILALATREPFVELSFHAIEPKEVVPELLPIAEPIHIGDPDGRGDQSKALASYVLSILFCQGASIRGPRGAGSASRSHAPLLPGAFLDVLNSELEEGRQLAGLRTSDGAYYMLARRPRFGALLLAELLEREVRRHSLNRAYAFARLSEYRRRAIVAREGAAIPALQQRLVAALDTVCRKKSPTAVELAVGASLAHEPTPAEALAEQQRLWVYQVALIARAVDLSDSLDVRRWNGHIEQLTNPGAFAFFTSDEDAKRALHMPTVSPYHREATAVRLGQSDFLAGVTLSDHRSWLDRLTSTSRTIAELTIAYFEEYLIGFRYYQMMPEEPLLAQNEEYTGNVESPTEMTQSRQFVPSRRASTRATRSMAFLVDRASLEQGLALSRLEQEARRLLDVHCPFDALCLEADMFATAKDPLSVQRIVDRRLRIGLSFGENPLVRVAEKAEVADSAMLVESKRAIAHSKAILETIVGHYDAHVVEYVQSVVERETGLSRPKSRPKFGAALDSLISGYKKMEALVGAKSEDEKLKASVNILGDVAGMVVQIEFARREKTELFESALALVHDAHRGAADGGEPLDFQAITESVAESLGTTTLRVPRTLLGFVQVLAAGIAIRDAYKEVEKDGVRALVSLDVAGLAGEVWALGSNMGAVLEHIIGVSRGAVAMRRNGARVVDILKASDLASSVAKLGDPSGTLEKGLAGAQKRLVLVGERAKPLKEAAEAAVAPFAAMKEHYDAAVMLKEGTEMFLLPEGLVAGAIAERDLSRAIAYGIKGGAMIITGLVTGALSFVGVGWAGRVSKIADWIIFGVDHGVKLLLDSGFTDHRDIIRSTFFHEFETVPLSDPREHRYRSRHGHALLLCTADIAALGAAHAG